MDAIVTSSYIFFTFSICNGHSMHSTVFSASELINDKITKNTGAPKLALRYGFHRTSECNNYEKAFLCIQKCVDHGFDIAYADKYCFCTCYVKQEKAKYTMPHKFDKTRWKLGTPKTAKPAWIQKLEDANPIITPESVNVVKKLKKTTKTKDNQNFPHGDSKNETIYIHHAPAIVKSTIIDSKIKYDATVTDSRSTTSALNITGGEHTPTATNKIDSGIENNETESSGTPSANNIIVDEDTANAINETEIVKESNVTLETTSATSTAGGNATSIEDEKENNGTDSSVTTSANNIIVGEQTANATNETKIVTEGKVVLETTSVIVTTGGKATVIEGEKGSNVTFETLIASNATGGNDTTTYRSISSSIVTTVNDIVNGTENNGTTLTR